MTYKTEQEVFWAGQFGSEYIDRNKGDALLASNLHFFANALRAARGVETCIELGANIGMNLKALKHLHPTQEQFALEINSDAVRELANVIPPSHIYEGSLLDFEPLRTWDLVLVKGVLIHIDPDALARIYDQLVAASGKYLLVAEYYNPTPVSVPYRGHAHRLFKRDFAGDIISHHPEMELLDYGFAYRGDPIFPQDDITWFLLEKRS